MRIIDRHELKKLFLGFLLEAKYELEADDLDVSDIHFGKDPAYDNTECVFDEYQFYNEYIDQVNDLEEYLITPAIFAYDGADIINNPSYDCYSELVAFEFLGFEKQREAFRKLLEKFVTNIRGKTFIAYYDPNENKLHYDDGITVGDEITCIISVEMPELSDTISQSGYDRFQAYVNMDITVLSGIEYSNVSDFTIDNNTLPITTIKISRQKSTKAFNNRTEETLYYAENQTLVISIAGMLNKNSDICKKIEDSILDSDKLNNEFNINYKGHHYSMILSNGELDIVPGDTVSFNATFTTMKNL